MQFDIMYQWRKRKDDICNYNFSETKLDYRKILYLKAFGVADYEFDIGFSEFKMADIAFQKANDFRGTLYFKVFEVADYEFDIGIQLGSHCAFEEARIEMYRYNQRQQCEREEYHG